jgi:hypothetical protein
MVCRLGPKITVGYCVGDGNPPRPAFCAAAREMRMMEAERTPMRRPGGVRCNMALLLRVVGAVGFVVLARARCVSGARQVCGCVARVRDWDCGRRGCFFFVVFWLVEGVTDGGACGFIS